MSDQDIFNSNNNPVDPQDANHINQNQPSADDPFAVLVGEGKRYKSPQELAKGKLEADQYIEKLKQEQAELREELEKRLKAEEALSRMEAARKESTTSGKSLDEATVEKLALSAYQKARQQEVTEANIDQANAAVVQAHGDKAREFVAQKAQELGMTVDDLKATAAKSPKAFLSLVGLNGNVTTPNVPKSSTASGSINTAASIKPNGGEYTKSYYDQLRKADPKTYFSARVQNEMFNQLKKLGDDFYR